MVSANKNRSRIIDGGGRIVLTETGRGFDPPAMVSLETIACDNPDCRVVTLRGETVRSSVAPGAARGVLAAQSRTGFPTARRLKPVDGHRTETDLQAEFNVDSGEVRASTDGGAGENEFVDLLRERLQGSLATVLRRRWRRAKGLEDRTSWRDADWSWWKPGLMVPRHEIFPDSVDLMLDLGSSVYWAEDLYCVAPLCECREVIVKFHDLADRTHGLAGSITVDYEDWKVTEISPDTACSSSLRRAWNRLRDVEPDLRARLRQWHEDMKEAGEELAPSSRETPVKTSRRPEKWERELSIMNLLQERTIDPGTTDLVDELTRWGQPFPEPVVRENPKVGRNDPCPCGSGKKYKRCCMDR